MREPLHAIQDAARQDMATKERELEALEMLGDDDKNVVSLREKLKGELGMLKEFLESEVEIDVPDFAAIVPNLFLAAKTNEPPGEKLDYFLRALRATFTGYKVTYSEDKDCISMKNGPVNVNITEVKRTLED
jgi:hypothetical protein